MGLTSFWYSKLSEPIHKGKRTGVSGDFPALDDEHCLKEECHFCNSYLFFKKLVRPIESVCCAIPLWSAGNRRNSILH